MSPDRERAHSENPIVDFLHLNCIFQSRNVIVLPTYPTSMCFELLKSQIQFNLNFYVLHIEYQSFDIGKNPHDVHTIQFDSQRKFGLAH